MTRPNFVDYEIEWLMKFDDIGQSRINTPLFWYLFLNPHMLYYILEALLVVK